MAEIAGPHRLAGLATAQVDAHGDFALLHDALAVFFAVGRVAPALGDHVHIVQVQLDAVLVQVGNARVAHGGQDAAQVRVAGVKGGFHQRRMGNGVGGQAAFLLGLATIDLHGDELGRALAIAHDGLGQQAGHVLQSGFQRLGIGAGVPIGDRCIARPVCGHDDEGIVGRGVAINRHAVERALGQLPGQPLQQRRGNGRIGGQKAQHGRHVGANHARALADAGNGHGFAIHRYLAAVGLGLGVGGHDAFGGGQPVVCLGVGNGSGQAGRNALDRQRLHDHAGRKRQDLRGGHAQFLGQGGAGGAGAGQAIGPSAGIGIARIDEQGANALAACQMLTADLHGRGAIAVLRKHPGHAGAFVEQKNTHVFAVGFAHTGFGHANAHTGNGVQISSLGQGKIDGHGRDILCWHGGLRTSWELCGLQPQVWAWAVA